MDEDGTGRGLVSPGYPGSQTVFAADGRYGFGAISLTESAVNEGIHLRRVPRLAVKRAAVMKIAHSFFGC